MEIWKQILRKNFTSLETLAQFLAFSPERKKQLLSTPKFPLNVPERLAKKIEKNTLEDPILRQFVPLREELVAMPGFAEDPVQDQTFCKTEKLLQKYRGRALLLATSACAMHCRFCFRQNFPYETANSGFDKEIEAIAKDSTLSEIILSGGDPLSLSDSSLDRLLHSLDRIPHIKRIRFHSRFPIGIPERITASFLDLLRPIRKKAFFVLHCNHARELDPDVIDSMEKVRTLGIPVLSQSVLLKGVNDTPESLLELCEALIDAQITPYYLHLLDPVQGTGHFLIPESRAIELLRFIQERLSGFGVPRLAKEEPGHPNKTFITY